MTSSCICFLELCGIDSQELRVDLEAARRIYYHRTEKDKKSLLMEEDLARREIIQLFISFSNAQEHIYNALQLLEEATKTYSVAAHVLASCGSW